MTSDTGFQRLAEGLERLQIPYCVCGSLASSVHGIYRTTADIDLLASVRLNDAARLAAELGKEFYADAALIEDAIGRGRSFNLIHYASAYKFDIFPVSDEPYQQAQFERKKVESVRFPHGTVEVPVASAEDTIHSKLVWYRTGGCISERQWHDIRGIVEIQGDRLDREYMRRWAAHLKVDDLLRQALP